MHKRIIKVGADWPEVVSLCIQNTRENGGEAAHSITSMTKSSRSTSVGSKNQHLPGIVYTPLLRQRNLKRRKLRPVATATMENGLGYSIYLAVNILPIIYRRKLMAFLHQQAHRAGRELFNGITAARTVAP